MRGIRVTATGNKSFIVLTKDTTGSARRITLGQWPEMNVDRARKEAVKVLGQILSGTDPIAEKRKIKAESQTLGELLIRYLEGRDLKIGTKEDYAKRLGMGFADWKPLPASRITESMILKRHKELTERGKTLANGCFRVLRAVVRYGVAVGAIPSDPVVVLSKARLWHPNRRKDRVIPSDKLGDFLRGIESLPNIQDRAMILVMLFAGLRIGEVLALRWEDIDLDNRILTVRETKNGTDHTIPIAIPLVSVLSELHAQTGATLLAFSTTGEARSYPKKTIIRAVKATGVEFSPHDLRRTFATIAEAVGLPVTLIKRLLNHVTDNDVTGGYIRTELDTMRQAIAKIVDYIEAKARGSVAMPLKNNNGYAPSIGEHS